jgi:hypothetical protein
MNFTPPDKGQLIAMAGWALSMKDMASDQQHLALCKFQEGCGELSECVDTIVVRQPVQKPITEHVVNPGLRSHREQYPMPATDFPETDAEILESLDQYHGRKSAPSTGGCRHRFDITTQKCQLCNKSYVEIKGVKPDFMESSHG